MQCRCIWLTCLISLIKKGGLNFVLSLLYCLCMNYAHIKPYNSKKVDLFLKTINHWELIYHTCDYYLISLQFPTLYQQGAKNLFFGWYRVGGWMANGFYASLITFLLSVCLFSATSTFSNGRPNDMASLGTTMFNSVVWAVNIQIVLSMSHFTWIQHVCVWGSILVWYVFILAYDWFALGDFYMIFSEVLAPSPVFWLTTLLVIVFCNLPYFFHIAFERILSPMDHHVIQELKYLKRDVHDQGMWERERSRARQETKIGFTARVDAKIRHIKGRLHRRGSCMGDIRVLSNKSNL